MAFESVNSNNVQGTKMAIGSSYTGYVVDFVKSTQYEQTNIIMQNATTGRRETFLAAGNLKYIINDGKIVKGVLTRITRTADKPVKGGKTSSQFTVEQDMDAQLSDAQFEALGNDTPTSNTTTTTDVGSLANEKIKRSAASLQAQATKAK